MITRNGCKSFVILDGLGNTVRLLLDSLLGYVYTERKLLRESWDQQTYVHYPV